MQQLLCQDGLAKEETVLSGYSQTYLEGLLVHVSGVNNTLINQVLPAVVLYSPGVGATGPLHQLSFFKT